MKINLLHCCAAALSLACFTGPASASDSSQMDAPLISRDPAANIGDVYAFRSANDQGQYLTTALTVYPFEEPGSGPNAYNFDPNVLYEIHVAFSNDLAKGKATLSYQFQFATRYKNTGTILQSYLDVIQNVDDAGQNLTQTYTVTKLDHRNNKRTVLGTGVVPPNNQGIATPFYNQDSNGDYPARPGVAN